MRKSRQFRPSVSENHLEERVVLSVSAAQVPTPAVFFAPSKAQVATTAGVTATLNQLHSALLTYQHNVTNAILFAQSQIKAGTVTQATAIDLLSGTATQQGYLGNKTSLLFSQARTATGNLPYGSGFNGYINSTHTAVGDLPSGANSLYANLTFPSSTTVGPLITLQDNVFNAVTAGNFTAALRAVNNAAIRSTYAQIKTLVSQYVINGVRHHDFTFQA